MQVVTSKGVLEGGLSLVVELVQVLLLPTGPQDPVQPGEVATAGVQGLTIDVVHVDARDVCSKLSKVILDPFALWTGGHDGGDDHRNQGLDLIQTGRKTETLLLRANLPPASAGVRANIPLPGP